LVEYQNQLATYQEEQQRQKTEKEKKEKAEYERLKKIYG
jgi:hypothetical protein